MNNNEIYSEEMIPANNYLKGILLGILFSLGGVAVWILLGLINFYASFAAYLIGFLFYLGVIKGPVKPTNKLIGIVTVYTIVVSMIANYISFAIAVMRSLTKQGYDTTFMKCLLTEAPYNITDNPDMSPTFWINFGLAFLFAGLGSYSIFKYMRQRQQA